MKSLKTSPNTQILGFPHSIFQWANIGRHRANSGHPVLKSGFLKFIKMKNLPGFLPPLSEWCGKVSKVHKAHQITFYCHTFLHNFWQTNFIKMEKGPGLTPLFWEIV